MPNLVTHLKNMAELAQFIANPMDHRAEIATTYQEMRSDVLALRQCLADMASSLSADSPEAMNIQRKSQHAIQAAYGVFLALALILNMLLRVFDFYDPELHNDCDAFCLDVLKLANEVAQYRPLGASYMPLPLVIAWTATDDMPLKYDLRATLADYQTDFPSNNWMRCKTFLDKKFLDLRLQQQAQSVRISEVITLPNTPLWNEIEN